MSRQIRNAVLIVFALVLLLGSRAIANFVIEYQWWQEMGQLATWFSMLLYEILPATAASLLAWAALLWAHRMGVQFAGAPLREYRLYARITPVVLLLFAILFCGSSIDAWTVMAFVGALGIETPPDVWLDPVFSKSLAFYLFDLPFYSLLLRYVFVVAFFSVLIFWVTGRGWQIYERLRRFRSEGGSFEEFDPGPNPLLLAGATQTSFARILGGLALAAVAVWFFLGRYSLLMNQHEFMTGMDFVDENVSLPLRWLVILAFLAAIPLVAQARLKLTGIVLGGALLAHMVLPGIVRAVYVRPNELEVERSYIERHLDATRQAYGLEEKATERTFEVSDRSELDVAGHRGLIENIRLWDWRAFSDTIKQVQALRPYYDFPDVDVDRYFIDGKIKQVLLSPREIDINSLPPEARERWVNLHFIYTHGYGVVMSEVNRTTPDGLPILLIQDAPPEVKAEDLRLERPEIYYGELTHDPVFVNSDQKEFDYPSGDQNITSHYAGTGGFPIHSLLMRLAAAVRSAEYNILLTGMTNENSRMMLYRNVHERLRHLADFVHWDPDPYLTVTGEGELVWIVDGYTASDSHPYSAQVFEPRFGGAVNYARNAVKATVNAYDGTTRLYVFDEEDPILQAYRNLFPDLFWDAGEMPASVRRHVRYPQLLFALQAHLYRTFHMKDPEVFYNKEDIWEIGRSLSGDTGQATPMQPTYVVARLPDEEEPEFLLMLPFTPRNKDNLIGWMAARCDGEKLGELIFFQLSKQELVFGPNQIESRINQNQEIARDLTLWDQRGSRVLRGDMLALPLEDNFLYVEPIYIQAETARMPQLRKVVLALGDRLVYEDTFEQALAALTADPEELPSDFQPAKPPSAEEEAPDEPGAPPMLTQRRLEDLAQRLRNLRQQAEGLVQDLGEIEEDLSAAQ